MKKVVMLIVFSLFFNLYSIEHNIFPVLGYAGENGVMLGAIYNGISDKKLKYTPEKTELYYIFFYTTENQISTTFKPKIQVFEGKYQYEAEFRYENWPSTFYNIGINSEDKEHNYTKEKFEMQNRLIKRIKQYGFFAENKLSQVNFLNSKDVDAISLETLPSTEFFENYFSHQLSLGLQFDTRDDGIFPTKGQFHELTYVHASTLLGSDEIIDRMEVDLRQYFSFNKDNVFAFQAFASYTTGKIKLLSYKKLGEHLRGYKSSRYIDEDELGFRAEYRTFPFDGKYSKRFGFVAFSEFGTVEKNWVTDGIDKIRNDFGVGLRWTISENNRMNIKLDIAFHKDGKNVNIDALEAF